MLWGCIGSIGLTQSYNQVRRGMGYKMWGVGFAGEAVWSGKGEPVRVNACLMMCEADAEHFKKS